MKVSYNWLQTYFDKKLPSPEKLGELLNEHAFELEGLEKTGNDAVLDLKVLPDRAHYALSHKGVASEAAAVTGLSLKPRSLASVPVDASVENVEVRVEDQKLCPRYVARRIDGVHVGDSPKWLKEGLEAIGQRSINSIVDALNFVMFDIGQPLHAFDAEKIKGAIAVRKAKKGEKITLLDGREVELLESDLLIADDEGPLVIAGVKGGKRAEVTSSTRSIIIESANFNPTAVRRTSTRANLRNDSSKRFENEITPSLAGEAMEQVTALILGLSKGAKAGAVTDSYPHPVKSWTVEIDPTYIDAVAGLSLTPKEIKSILTSLSCRVEEKGGAFLVTPPLERLDLRIPEDFADEVGRLHGYDRLQSVETPTIVHVPEDRTFYWSEKAKDALVRLGFSETLLYTLVPKGAFEISYPLASDKSALRERISPKLIESLAMNIRNADLLGLETIKIFEIGRIFPKTGEKTSLALGVALARKKKGVTAESCMKEALTALASALGVTVDGKIETTPHGSVVEIDFDAIIAKLPEKQSLEGITLVPLAKDLRYKPFSPYPYIVRDIAFFTPSGTNAAEVTSFMKEAAHTSAGSLLIKGPSLFDTFEKDGKVSYAFRMIFQSFERTLSDDEANSVMESVYGAVKSKGWHVR